MDIVGELPSDSGRGEEGRAEVIVGADIVWMVRIKVQGPTAGERDNIFDR
jgi:hypothetical protein